MSEPYKSMGRSWIKLWVPEWLDGTSRYEMSGGQRAFWVDLLTLAGRSRIPGIVCAGEDPNNLFGYPLDRYSGILGDGSVDILETFKLFESQGKIELIVTREEPPKLYAVKILSWAKYQSEYMRQRASRKKTRQGAPKVTPKNTPRCSVEGEEEGEVDGDGEGEKRQRKMENIAAAAFSCIGFAAPFGGEKFQKVFLRRYTQHGPGEWLTEMMEAVIQECQRKKIGIPPQFYDAKRDVEKRENASMNSAAPL